MQKSDIAAVRLLIRSKQIGLAFFFEFHIWCISEKYNNEIEIRRNITVEFVAE